MLKKIINKIFKKKLTLKEDLYSTDNDLWDWKKKITRKKYETD